MQDATSIDQQQRRCRERADANGQTILPDLQFKDEAISGTQRNRAGLSAMMDAAREGKFSTLYLDCLSRLARDVVGAMDTLNKLVHCHVQIISVTEGIDTADDNWELGAVFRSWMHQEYIKTLRGAVLRGKTESIFNDWSVGDHCFGYSTEPIPGTENSRRGRQKGPRKRAVIYEPHASWVRKIFHYFAEERRSLSWIARELTRLGVPKDHRSLTTKWTQDLVRKRLRSLKYIGIWSWGKKTNVRDPSSGAVRQEDRPLEEIAQWERQRPELRIIDDDTFFKAQALLDENDAACAAYRQNDGTLKGSRGSDHRQPRHLLQGLIRCASCGGRFHTNGLKKRYMVCANYLNGSCTCRTRLPRELAERLILAALSERIFRSPEWFQLILNEAHRAWEKHQQANPDEAKGLEQALAEIDRKIQRLVDSVEKGDADPEISTRLGARREEKADLQRRLMVLREAQRRFPTPPDEAWLTGKLQHLETVLAGDCPAAAEALRDLLGEVVVEEIGRPGRKRKALRGMFMMDNARVLSCLERELGDAEATTTASGTVVLDFVEKLPWEALANRVKELFDQCLTDGKIAEKLGCATSWVPKALKVWCTENGTDISAIRQRPRPRAKPSLAERLADRAKTLWDQGMLLQDIAETLTCDRNVVTWAIQHWHISRGLPVPDGRTRRKLLPKSDNIKKSGVNS